MKVHIIGTRGFPNVQGGVEKHCEELYPRLAKRGFDITVFARKSYCSTDNRVGEWQRVKIIYLWSPRIKGFEVIIHTFIATLISTFKRPDIVHFHNIGPALFIPVIKLCGIKTVLTYHSINYHHQKWGYCAKLILRFGEFLGIKFANKIIVVSKTTKDFLIKKWGKKDLRYIPNGVNLPEYIIAGKTLGKYNLKPQNYVFTACRFEPAKGLRDLVDAYVRIAKPKFKLVIAGDDNYETDYSRKLKKQCIDNGVILTGFVSGESLKELYSHAGLFVLPSYHEGLPIALLEALSYGLPVLASDIPQNKIIDLPDFRFFPVGNIGILSDKIQKLIQQGISEEERLQQMSMLKEEYNWDKVAESTGEVYRET